MTLEYQHSLEAGFGNRYYDKYVQAYFLLGSVEAVLRKYPSDGISFPELHRQLDRRGIVKLRGSRMNDLSCVTSFFSHLVSFSAHRPMSATPFYMDQTPLSVKERLSLPWILNVLTHIVTDGEKRPNMARNGTALLISHPEDSNRILVADELTRTNTSIGKWQGAITLPMGYSDGNQKGALRILQQEVFSNQASSGLLRKESPLTDLLLRDIKILGHIKIAHVNVSIQHIPLPANIDDPGLFSSSKIGNFRFMNIKDLICFHSNSHDLRSGVVDISKIYQGHLENKQNMGDVSFQSTLNTALKKIFVLNGDRICPATSY